MSASPAGPTPGRTPNGTLPAIIRRQRATDPMVRPKDRNKRRPQHPPGPMPNNGGGLNGAGLANGQAVLAPARTQFTVQQHTKPPQQSSSLTGLSILDASGETIHSGFSSPAVAEYVDYPVILTKKELMEGTRHHVARFYSKKNIDPRNEAEFTRPVRLHRRDPRAPPPGVKEEDAMASMGSKEDLLEKEEREKQELLRERRDVQREAEAAKEAPSAKSGNQKFSAFKKKTEQRFQVDETEEQRVKSQLRYQEAIPWHLEDFDNKQTWVGSYEAALSETYAQIIFQDGKARITPVEKWYKFAPKATFKTLTIDEAEKRMNSKVTGPRWFMDKMKEGKEKTEDEKAKKKSSKLYRGKINAQDDINIMNAGVGRRGDAGVGELDFEEDFADDEENPVLEGDDEDAKEAEARIKRDQLQSNVFDIKREKDYEKAEALEKNSKAALKEHGKKVKRALMKREKNYIYDSDSENPYSPHASNNSTDTETERLKKEKIKKEEEEKTVAEKTKSTNPPSGSSTKGNNTPSHRSNKRVDPLQRTASSNSLKRPGSPNISEASGNESSRKKHKKKHGSTSNLGTGISTPNGPPSRPRSPTFPNTTLPDPPTKGPTPPPQQLQRKLSSIRLNVYPEGQKRERNAGSGSDGEGAGSSAEMSDGTRKRIKLRVGSPTSKTGSPNGSRATSPDRVNVAAAAANRVGSSEQLPFPTVTEVKAAIPSAGTTIAELLKIFKGRIHGDERKKQFAALMRQVGYMDQTTKLLRARK